jgi:hypothetical protein
MTLERWGSLAYVPAHRSLFALSRLRGWG